MTDKNLCKERVLIVSNNALAMQNSNGRTLLNLLQCIPTAQLAQFYIHGTPDEGVCASYYQVSDQDALHTFLHRKKASQTSHTAASTETDKDDAVEKKKIPRNCRNLVLRNFVWMRFCWWKQDFDAFVCDFRPTVVLLQAGDAPFMYAIAMRISKQYNIPLIMYNSEGYVLKHTLYADAKHSSVWHRILQTSLKRVYKKTMQQAAYCVYITEYLEACYQEKYPHPGRSIALYTASDMQPLADASDPYVFKVLYCGNLGVGRSEKLSDFANVLFKVDPKAVLEIYGCFPSEMEQEKLCALSNVSYRGVVPYEEVAGLMSHASLVLHCEKDDRVNNLRHAFSTKIADCLACGRPFLVYASREYPFVQYLEQNQCAHIASGDEELQIVLQKCKNDIDFRNWYIDAALRIAQKNHCSQRNSEIMRDIVEQVTQECCNKQSG